MRKIAILLSFLVILRSDFARCSSDDDWDRSPEASVPDESPAGDDTTDTEEVSSVGTTVTRKVTWDVALSNAPELIGTLGELLAASAGTDFDMAPYRGRGANTIRHSRFRPAVLHLVNEGWKVMGAVENNVQKIRLHSLTLPNHAKKTLQFMRSSSPAVVKKFAKIPITAMEQAVTQILSAQKDSKKQFSQWRSSLNIMNERIKATAASYEQRGVQTDTDTEQAKSSLVDAQREYNEAEQAYKEADEALDKARDAYNEGLSALSPDTGSERSRGRGSRRRGRDDDDDSDDEDALSGSTGTVKKTVTIQEVEGLRKTMAKAQKNYDRTYRNFRQAAEKLKDAKVKNTGLKFENKKLNSVDQVLEKSTELSPKFLEQADTLWQFFTSLDNILVDRLKESLKATKRVVGEVVGKANPREALVSDSALRDRLVQEITKVVNDSAVALVLSTAYGDVSDRYVVDNLSKLAKLQNAEGSELAEKLRRFRGHIASGKDNVKEAVNKAARKFPAISREWQVQVEKFEQSLQPTERTVATA